MSIGIYLIANLCNGKKYVGQSWNIERRWYAHKNKEDNNHLKKSFSKYGIDKFSFKILKEFEENENTQRYLDIFEDIYILVFDTMDPEFGYNKKRGGSKGKHTDETKEKIRQSNIGINLGRKHTNETREKMRQSGINKHLGRRLSPETKEKIRLAHIGCKLGKKLSAEHKEKINRTKLKKVQCVETGAIYPSVKEAIEITKVKQISSCARGDQKTAGGYTWKYV